MYIYMGTHIYTCGYIYMHINTPTYTHTYTHTDIVTRQTTFLDRRHCEVVGVGVVYGSVTKDFWWEVLFFGSKELLQ